MRQFSAWSLKPQTTTLHKATEENWILYLWNSYKNRRFGTPSRLEASAPFTPLSSLVLEERD